MASELSYDQLGTCVSLPVQRLDGEWYPVEYFPNGDKIEQIRQLEIRSDDILIASFPKSGTAWTQEIVWQIMTASGAPLQQEGHLDNRIPMLEFPLPGLKEIASRGSPRIMKTHVPFRSIPRDFVDGIGKVIYIARNAKDVCVSSYHYYRLLSKTKFQGSFSEFYDDFINGEVAFGPWTDHVADYWSHRCDSNMLFITYERLQKKPKETVRTIATFLGVPLTDLQVLTIVEKCNFKTMKNNPNTNFTWLNKDGQTRKDEEPFMRKGVVGDWVNYFTEEQAERMDYALELPLYQMGLTFALPTQEFTPLPPEPQPLDHLLNPTNYNATHLIGAVC